MLSGGLHVENHARWRQKERLDNKSVNYTCAGSPKPFTCVLALPSPWLRQLNGAGILAAWVDGLEV